MIVYSEKLMSNIEASLKRAFGDPSVSLNRRVSKSAGPFNIALQDFYGRGSQVQDGRVAFPIKRNGVHDEIFYFGFVGRFGVSQAGDDPYAHVLDHVSLTLFQKYPSGDLRSIVRAEWDGIVALDSNASHAQPHWHFTQDPKEIELLVRSFNGEEIEFGADLMFENILPIRKIHFAMGQSLTETGQVTFKNTFTEEAEFFSWFEHLVTYIVAQLSYVCGGSANEIMEFSAST